MLVAGRRAVQNLGVPVGCLLINSAGTRACVRIVLIGKTLIELDLGPTRLIRTDRQVFRIHSEPFVDECQTAESLTEI